MEVSDHWTANQWLFWLAIAFLLISMILRLTESNKAENVKQGSIAPSTILLVLFHLCVFGLLINYVVEIFRQYEIVYKVKN